MACSKPDDVCWCDCHMPVDDDGMREWKAWPKYDDPVALLSADTCVSCWYDHQDFLKRTRTPA